MKVGDWVHTKREIVLNFGGYGFICQPSELRIDAGMLGQIVNACSESRFDVGQIVNACSESRFDVRIPIVPMVFLTIVLREDELALKEK